jgi:hypothetical protein
MWSRMPIYQPGRGQVHTGGAPRLGPACRSTVLNALLKSSEVKQQSERNLVLLSVEAFALRCVQVPASVYIRTAPTAPLW